MRNDHSIDFAMLIKPQMFHVTCYAMHACCDKEEGRNGATEGPCRGIGMYVVVLSAIHRVLLAVGGRALVYLTVLGAAFQCGGHPSYSAVGRNWLDARLNNYPLCYILFCQLQKCVALASAGTYTRSSL